MMGPIAVLAALVLAGCGGGDPARPQAATSRWPREKEASGSSVALGATGPEATEP